jgi:hypothetical protein
MRRLIILTLLAGVLALPPSGASAHGGGHRGGCEEFGRTNLWISQNSEEFAASIYEDFGIQVLRDNNLGGIVSFFANKSTNLYLQPGIGDLVRDVDHAACG